MRTDSLNIEIFSLKFLASFVLDFVLLANNLYAFVMLLNHIRQQLICQHLNGHAKLVLPTIQKLWEFYYFIEVF